jgi:hypothetical protein
MKKRSLIPMLCGAALLLCSCGEKTPESSVSEETAETTAVTTTTTLPREYAEGETTSATTAVTEADDTPKTLYLTADDITLSVLGDTVRPYKCEAEITNHGEEKQKYTFDFRILYAGTETEYTELPEYEADPYEERYIEPEETRTLKYDWTKRYGQLPDGEYTFEVLLGKVKDEEEDEDAPEKYRVCRTEFTVVSEGYVPKVYFREGDVSASNATLTIENTPDAGRSYCLIYRVYDADHNEIIRMPDTKAQLNGIGYVKAGEIMQLEFNWRDSYGILPNGEYSLVIELLADGEKDAKSYSIPFTIS